ncbi:MAG TPA: DUF4301 family protein, partial [Flavobacterium sp.]|nr:DUF4301 family protein [Flavobacterium sp.]
PFHQYPDFIATPIEEHLKESVFYASSKNSAHLHFTISEEHRASFEAVVGEVKPKVEAASNTRIFVDYSHQSQATDMLSADLKNNPFRLEDGSLFFRPGGHGALIENLNQLSGDIIFLKNIDNVGHGHVETVGLYKKVLAGILLELQEKVFRFLNVLSSGTFAGGTIEEIVQFLRSGLQVNPSKDFNKYTLENKREYLVSILDRPIRVCGMVKNEGEPGGGPFWVRDAAGSVSLQIVEASQIDIQNPGQKKILADATHFNPVDLVCGIKNHKGEKFDLNDFVDHENGFIVEKTIHGKPLKAYELPGLWNGAMAKWITVFVEVPLMTFNPVKTVNDLLKPGHQPQ